MLSSLQVIAHARNGFTEKFGIPRQAGRADAVLTRIVFTPAYRVAEALRGIEEYSHLWLIWGFSENEQKKQTMSTDSESSSPPAWSPTVRPPRLGGNKRVGVFASRSPFRPNGLGLSSVRLERVEKTANEGMVLVVSGADLMNGTPIYDIKPYLPYTDIHTEATSGWAAQNSEYRLAVQWEKNTKHGLSKDETLALEEILQEDPRPAYQHDGRDYALTYSGWNVHFRVEEKTAVVFRVEKAE